MNDLKDFSTSLEKEIKKADSIAIISHVSPDGDNLGSLEALSRWISISFPRLIIGSM